MSVYICVALRGSPSSGLWRSLCFVCLCVSSIYEGVQLLRQQYSCGSEQRSYMLAHRQFAAVSAALTAAQAGLPLPVELAQRKSHMQGLCSANLSKSGQLHA